MLSRYIQAGVAELDTDKLPAMLQPETLHNTLM